MRFGNKRHGYRHTEKAWGEVTDDKRNNVEELNEGSYSCKTLTEGSCWDTYAWESNQDWNAVQYKIKGTLEELFNNGIVKLDWRPDNSDTSENKWFIGTLLNPDLSAQQGHKFKEHLFRYR